MIRCKICNKLVTQAEASVMSHFRLKHKGLDIEDRNKAMEAMLPSFAKKMKYNKLKARLRQGERLSGEEFGFVNAWDQRSNRRASSLYSDRAYTHDNVLKTSNAK